MEFNYRGMTPTASSVATKHNIPRSYGPGHGVLVAEFTNVHRQKYPSRSRGSIATNNYPINRHAGGVESRTRVLRR
jgi:hypothetical protein